MKILIVGGGIVGLSIARAARRKGHEVVLFEQRTVPNPRSASWDSHRMIRHHYGAAIGYTRMVDQAFAAWNGVWQDLGARHYCETGAVAVSLKPADYADRSLTAFRELGVDHEVLEGAAFEQALPQYRRPRDSFAVMTRSGGPLFADRIVAGLAAYARDAGAQVREGARIVDLDEQAGTVTLETGECVAGDAVVVSAGAWIGNLLREYANIPSMRQVLAYVAPPPALADAWRNAPALAAYGDCGGYILPGVMGTDLKLGAGEHRRPASPDEVGFETEPGEAKRVIGHFADILVDADAYEPLRLTVGYYLMDESRRFRIERRGRALVVTNCDGQMFKFGPLVGEQTVAALEGRISAGDLAAWARGAG